jgi:hypothetical protein
VLDASEWAARASGTIETPAPADADAETQQPEAMDEVPVPRRGMMVLPEGYKANQMKAEQPITTYGDFLYKKLGEIGRCINFPLTMMNLDSSTSNLSARYLDVQPYVRDRQMEREGYNCFLDRDFDMWLTEALCIPGYLPAAAARVLQFPHEWVWPELGKHADPDKVASAQAQELKSGTTTIPDIYSARGENWERKQEAGAKALGLTVAEYQKLVITGIFGPPPNAPAPNAPVTTQQNEQKPPENPPVSAKKEGEMAEKPPQIEAAKPPESPEKSPLDGQKEGILARFWAFFTGQKG